MPHRYILEPYKGKASRYHCPACKSREKTFTCYIDTSTGQHLAAHVGKCERANNCGYHFTPKQFFAEHAEQGSRRLQNIRKNGRGLPEHPAGANVSLKPILPPESDKNRRITVYPPQALSTIPAAIFKASLQPGAPVTTLAEGNVLIGFLVAHFGARAAAELVSRYYIGTSKHWPGATVFWQIDAQANIRTGKIIQYRIVTHKDTFSGQDCKRNKTNKPPTYWAHKAAKLEGFNLRQCLYGEHLLSREPNKPVAIVESEKTAIIASAYLPDLIWLSCGGLEHLSVEKCKVLAGRTVILYPDLKGLQKWEAKRMELSAICRCDISDYLECRATEAEKAAGLDLADYLLKLPPDTFFTREKKGLFPHDKKGGQNLEEPETFTKPNIQTALNDDEKRDTPASRETGVIAYVDAAGRLYIQTPTALPQTSATTYTVYPSILHYNERLSLPEFVPISTEIQGKSSVTIDLATLTVIDPVPCPSFVS